MNKQFLIKLGVPIIALSLVAACGTGTNDNQDPAEEEVPTNEAPLNQEDDNNVENPAEDDGMNNGGTDDGMNGEEGMIEDDGTMNDGTNEGNNAGDNNNGNNNGENREE